MEIFQPIKHDELTLHNIVAITLPLVWLQFLLHNTTTS